MSLVLPILVRRKKVERLQRLHEQRKYALTHSFEQSATTDLQ